MNEQTLIEGEFSNMLSKGVDGFKMYSEKNIKDMEILDKRIPSQNKWKTDEEVLAESRKNTHHYTSPKQDYEFFVFEIAQLKEILECEPHRLKFKELPAYYYDDLEELRVIAEIYGSYDPKTAPVSWWHNDCTDEYLNHIYSPEKIQAHKAWKQECVSNYEAKQKQEMISSSPVTQTLKKRSSSMSM